MERTRCRLYSGPLSWEGQRVLAALRAQRQHAARENQGYSSRQRMERRYGNPSPRVHSSTSLSQEEKRNPYLNQSKPHASSVSTSCHDSQRQNSPASQIPACVLSSQTSSSSSSWRDSSLHRLSLQTAAYYQDKQKYSHRKYQEPPTYPSGGDVSFTQQEGSERTPFSRRDRHSPSLQTPDTLCEHQAARHRKDEIKVSFTLDPSPEDPVEDVVSLTAVQKVHTEDTVESTRIKDGEVKSKESDTDRTEMIHDAVTLSRGKMTVSKALSETEGDHCGAIETGGVHPSPPSLTHGGGKKGVEQGFGVENVTEEAASSGEEQEMSEVLSGTGREEEEEEEEWRQVDPHGGASASQTEGAPPVGNERDLSSVSVDGNRDSSNASDRKEEYHASSLAENSLSVERHTGSPQAMRGTSEPRSTERALGQAAELARVDTRADKGTTEGTADLMQVGSIAARKSQVTANATDKTETEPLPNRSDGQVRLKQCERHCDETEKDTNTGDRKEDGEELVMPALDGREDSRSESFSAPRLVHECEETQSSFRNPGVWGNHQRHGNHPGTNGINRGPSSRIRLIPAGSIISGQDFDKSSAVDDFKREQQRTEDSIPTTSQPRLVSLQPPLIPSFSLKRKREAPQNAAASTRRPPKWEPPRSTQEWNKDRGVREHKGTGAEQSAPPAENHRETSPLHGVGKELAEDVDSNRPKQTSKSKEYCESGTNALQHRASSVIVRSTKNKRATYGPEPSHLKARSAEPQTPSKAASLTSDPRIKYSGKLSEYEKIHILEKAIQSEALVLTLVYSDGSTQLDPRQKLTPAVCGFLLLMKNDLERSTPDESLGPNDSLVYCKLEHTPAWAQQRTHPRQELFTRDMLLQVMSTPRLVVCYKAKELVRVALPWYRTDLTWKQGCRIQDPQVSGWLLDPADPASCFQDLLNKHCRKPRPPPAVGTEKVSRIISGLSSLYWLNVQLRSKLQSQGLWELYSEMELHMIPVLSAMESHPIHVDKDALKRTSDLLGAKMKQLEQDAHRAAGQIFLLTSSTQLRTVLFEKLRLHERCDTKKLPKTLNKQQSTSEAALLQLQDLHPLPKIVLEYRQVHKIKSTFIDGILSCMMTKNYISSTWFQTSAVTGRISSKHPNFQALPRQPLHITRKQYIQGNKEETFTVHPRDMFISQDGWTFVSADFCQVELRLLGHLTADPELLRIFTNPEADVFSTLAAQWKGIGENEVTSEDREHAKRIVYSVVYGAGPDRLSGILGVSAEQARRFQDSFLRTYKEVPAFIQRTIHQCQDQGHVLTIMGRRRTLPNINSPDWAVRMQAERQAVNFVVQGSAADLCKTAMIRIFHLLCSSSSLSARLLAQLHDELLYEVQDSQVQQFAALVKNTMESLQHMERPNIHLKSHTRNVLRVCDYADAREAFPTRSQGVSVSPETWVVKGN